MHEIHRILTEARDLVTKGWTQKSLARDEDGVCNATWRGATKFCAQGALRRVSTHDHRDTYLLLRKYVGSNVVIWNDAPERTQAEVIALFNRVIFEEGGMSEAEYVLRHARGLVEAGWIQGSYARDAYGIGVHPEAPEAVCFCTAGAFMRVVHRDIIMMDFLFKAAAPPAYGGVFSGWNDAPDRTKEEVLAQFDVWILEASRDKYWGLT